MLGLRNIGYQASGTTLLSDVSFDLYAGEMVSLIGPNGAGKSTLVKIILGLLKPTSGHIHTTATNLSYVPQKFGIPQILPLRVQDLLNQANKRRLNADQKAFILEKLSIAPLINKQLANLSGGETQRVLLARALLDKPQLLILDEPMQGLDPDAESWLYHFIDELPDFLACAMLVVSHDLYWVMKGSKRVICLNKHICCQGVPSQIASTPEFHRLFGHFQPYIHHHDHCQHTNDCHQHDHEDIL
ncbi:metal ABC transporter ATP-binding protein [Moraxella sp. Tifton1]|nr:metal ABC transporter ATP-binding protein [Moraxella sp. Tifton1]MCL1623283.1 metal ABC transporter ATP-binding protein [Moraxella sp. Tifton1]